MSDDSASKAGDPQSVEEGEGRLRRFARKMLDRKELAEDTRDLLASVLATSDKAKSEFIRMTGREVRHYLEGLNLKQDLLELATNYKLEVHASFHLSPVTPAAEAKHAATADESDEGEAGGEGRT